MPKRITLLLVVLFAFFTVRAQTFSCPPCGCNSDGIDYETAGACPSCSMPLLNKEDPSEGYDFRNVYPQDLCGMKKEFVFLDVRTAGEFSGRLGHLKGAINIHVDDLEDEMEKLKQHRDKPILVYCLVSIRSLRASQMLVDNGFTDVTNLLGGMDMWNDLDSDDLPCKSELHVFE